MFKEMSKKELVEAADKMYSLLASVQYDIDGAMSYIKDGEISAFWIEGYPKKIDLLINSFQEGE